jgi:hypothetical protein
MNDEEMRFLCDRGQGICLYQDLSCACPLNANGGRANKITLLLDQFDTLCQWVDIAPNWTVQYCLRKVYGISAYLPLQ